MTQMNADFFLTPETFPRLKLITISRHGYSFN